MNGMTIVAEYNPELFSHLSGRETVMILDSTENLSVILDTEKKRKNTITHVIVRMKTHLSDLSFNPDWAEAPISFYLKSREPLKKMMSRAEDLRNRKIKIFLPASDDENLTYLRIISSIGIPCGLYFDSPEKPVNWDKVNDLMYYDVYGKIKHGPIDPFSSIIGDYDPKGKTIFHSVYFDDPNRFIHMDTAGNIALTRRHLETGNFLGKGLEDLDTVKESPKYKRYMTLWQGYFTGESKCSECPAWRICQGVFLETCEIEPACTQFMKDLMDAAAFKTSQGKGYERKWR